MDLDFAFAWAKAVARRAEKKLRALEERLVADQELGQNRTFMRSMENARADYLIKQGRVTRAGRDIEANRPKQASLSLKQAMFGCG